jgi:hypothetical protein
MSYGHASHLRQAVLGRRLLNEPDAPFDDGAMVVDSRDQSVGFVNCQTYRSATAARVDEPGEPAGWDVEVVYGDGARDEVDSEYLSVLDEEDA